jgi:hypothetical protein
MRRTWQHLLLATRHQPLCPLLRESHLEGMHTRLVGPALTPNQTRRQRQRRMQPRLRHLGSRGLSAESWWRYHRPWVISSREIPLNWPVPCPWTPQQKRKHRLWMHHPPPLRRVAALLPLRARVRYQRGCAALLRVLPCPRVGQPQPAATSQIRETETKLRCALQTPAKLSQ